MGSLASSQSDRRRDRISQSARLSWHELVAEAFHLGLDPPGETRNVGHSILPGNSNVSRTGAVGPQPQHLAMSRREPRYRPDSRDSQGEHRAPSLQR
jgi:hypothetical protein